jgi:hypothetical protein
MHTDQVPSLDADMSRIIEVLSARGLRCALRGRMADRESCLVAVRAAFDREKIQDRGYSFRIFKLSAAIRAVNYKLQDFLL